MNSKILFIVSYNNYSQRTPTQFNLLKQSVLLDLNYFKVCVCDCPAPEDIPAQFLRVRLAFEDGYPENAENPGGQRTIYPRLQDPQ